MKVAQEPKSAFAVYSEKLKQKKKPKKVEELSKLNKSNKLIKKKSQDKGKELMRIRQMNEIGMILKTLAEQSSAAKSDLGLVNSTPKKKLKLKNKNENGVNSPNNSENDKEVSKEVVHRKNRKKILIKGGELKKSHLKGKLKGKEETNDVVSLLLKKVKQDLKRPRENINSQHKKSSPECPNKANGDLSNGKSNSQKILQNKEAQNRKKDKRQLSSSNIIGNKKNNAIKAKKPKIQKITINSPNTNSQNVENLIVNNVLKTETKKLSKQSLKTNQSNRLQNVKRNMTFPNKSKNKNTIECKRDSNIIDDECKAMNVHWSNNMSSKATAKSLFEWLILPVKESNFMNDYWEQQPLLIQRDGSRDYYSALLSTPGIDEILRENNIFFTKHIDVTSYTNGVRETHNLSGRAQANVVWDFYSNGCSVRMLNPQAFVPKIHAVNAMLQEYFGCFVGANVYLTPPNSQGFAPHFDDIEAFVLQIEGKKRWKVYTPSSETNVLPRESSPNFKEEDLDEPFLDVVLEPGDLLYFPRGFIHQASTVEGEHSLHITLSAYQKTAWVDLLEKTLPLALKRAAQEDVEFRRGLPRDYLGLEYYGGDQEKTQFAAKASHLMERLSHYMSLSLGAGVDLMGAQFMHDALPPIFTPDEKESSGLGGGLKMKEGGELVNRVEIDLDTKVKLIRANVCRLVEEEEEVRLYHCLDNPLEYHAEEPQYLVLPREGLSVITSLFMSYPSFVEVRKLPHEDEEELLTLVSDLWDAGLLLAEGFQQVSSQHEESESN